MYYLVLIGACSIQSFAAPCLMVMQDTVELADQYTIRLDREFDGTPSMTVICRKVDPAAVNFDASNITNDQRLKAKIELTTDQLSRLKQIQSDLESATRRVIKEGLAKSNVDSPSDIHYRVQEQIEKLRTESQNKLAKVWSPRQKQLLETAQKRRLLLALGWEQILETLNTQDGLSLTSEQRRQWTDLRDRWCKDIRKRREIEQADAIRNMMKLIPAEQVAKLNQWLRQTDDNVQTAALPCIELWLAQLETAANSGVDTSLDPLDGLRVNFQMTVTGGLHMQRQFRCIAVELANSCLLDDPLDMVSLQFDDLLQAVRDPQSAAGAELAQCDRQIETIKRQMLTRQMDIEQAGSEMSKMFVKQDEIVWRTFQELLIPSQAEQLDRVLAEREVQNIGICASLLDGTLGKKIGVKKRDPVRFPLPPIAVDWLARKHRDGQADEGRAAIEAFARTEAERTEELIRNWEIEVTSKIEAILTPEQKAHLRTEYAAFNREAILVGHPELLFATRTLLNQSPPNRGESTAK